MVLLYLFIFMCSSCSSSEDSRGDVVARVNEKKLTKEQLVSLVGSTTNDSRALLFATNRWVEKTLLYNAAVKSGLKKDAEIIRKRDLFYEDLLVSSFLDIQTKNKIKITKKEVSNYYAKNKNSFTRVDDGIIIKHFVLPNNKESISLKKILKKGNHGAEFENFVEKYKPQTKELYRRTAESSAIGFVFSGSVGEVFGPKKIDGGFHLFEILKKYKKGSEQGLEVVYDEIYERLLKQKKEVLVISTIDSLYRTSDVFISQVVK